MKSSPEPIWKQHRRIKEEKEKGGGGGGGGTSGASEGTPAGGGNRDSQVQIQTGRKLTLRLGKASAEGKFNKDEVLEVLCKVRSPPSGVRRRGGVQHRIIQMGIFVSSGGGAGVRRVRSRPRVSCGEKVQ